MGEFWMGWVVLTPYDPELESLDWTQLLLRFSLRKQRESVCRKYCICVSQSVSCWMSLKTRLKVDNLNLLLSYCHPEISLYCLQSLYTFCNYFSYPKHFVWINGKIWLKRCAYVTPFSDLWPCWILTFDVEVNSGISKVSALWRYRCCFPEENWQTACCYSQHILYIFPSKILVRSHKHLQNLNFYIFECNRCLAVNLST